MQKYFEKKFLDLYQPVINEFITQVQDIDGTNLPEPFLPVIGEQYGIDKPRIVFMGWETRDAKSFKEWVLHFQKMIL